MTDKNNRIHILDQHTANQIAAGEVVERPFSVIKELVENALDAGATRISVIIHDACLEKMQVTDNGCGMSPDEMRLCVLRHATSKISNAADLDKLNTLGFRGEALPSIASVSQMTIISKQRGADEGYSLTVTGGKATIPQSSAARTGTTVIVDRLFYNMPARKKFLKSPRTEMGLVSELIAKYIVAYPAVSFRLQNGAHQIFASTGSGDPQNALFEAYGKSMAEQMLPFAYGFVSPPVLNRSNRNGYNFFINGRPVRSRELSNAVDAAYFSFLPERRYPIVFIFLELPPERLDVNVHPGKLEVKFRDFSGIKEQIVGEIQAVIGKSRGVAPRLEGGWESAEGEKLPDDKPEVPAVAESTPISDQSFEIPEENGSMLREARPSYGGDIYRTLFDKAKVKAVLASVDIPETAVEAPAAPEGAVQQRIFDGTVSDNDKKISYASLVPLGQFAGTFIICTAGEYLYIIDQHAAAERILFEKIAADAKENKGNSSQLAVPVAVELTYQEATLLQDMIIELRDYGFILEHFGENTFAIRAVPVWYFGDDPEQLLRLFLEELKDETDDLARIRKDELFMAACKQAIKANRYLTPADIRALLIDLDKCVNSATCPHGRPLAIRVSRSEIYKRFLRGSI